MRSRLKTGLQQWESLNTAQTISADRTTQDFWRDIDQNCFSKARLVLIESKKPKVWLSAWPWNPKPAINLSNFKSKTHEHVLCYNENMKHIKIKKIKNQEQYAPNAKKDLPQETKRSTNNPQTGIYKLHICELQQGKLQPILTKTRMLEIKLSVPWL